MSTAKDLIDKQTQLATDRSTFENHWSEIAPLILPRQDIFFNDKAEEGESRTKEKWEEAPKTEI